MEKLATKAIKSFKKSILYEESCLINEQIVAKRTIEILKKITDFLFPTKFASGVMKTRVITVKNKYKKS